jgi:dihydrofolate reductase
LKPIYIIVAIAQNGAIGRAGRLPWNLPEDWEYFKRTTRGGILIHGRRSQDHHASLLPDREVIVLTRDPDYTLPGARLARNLPDALAMAQASPHPGPIWIGGGPAIYREALPLADRVYLTEIHADFEADTFFPLDEIARAGFTKILSEKPGAMGGVHYTFKVLAAAAPDTAQPPDARR